MNIRDWSPLGWTSWISLQSRGLSSLLQHHSSEASILQCSAFFMVQISHRYKPRQCIKKQRHYFANKGLSSQSYDFSSSHVWMWQLDHKEAEHQRPVAFELWCWRRLLRVSPLVCKEIQPVHPKGDQSWIFIGRTDAEDEAPILWPPDVKGWLIRKNPDAGKDWR